MGGQRRTQCGILMVAWVCIAFVPAATLASDATNSTVRPFTNDGLLERFDKNRNGELDPTERIALREAFGGIDVPMLPTQPHDYTTGDYPPHVDRTEIDRMDNTPEGNPTTNAGAALGRVLFYDKLLSRNRTISCASCHLQRAGFADPERFSVGFEGGRTGRNSMSLAGLRYSNLKGNRPGFFWDERAVTLEMQVLMPIQDGVEMGMKLGDLEKRLQRTAYYPGLFESAFGSRRVTSDRISKAVAQFLRSLNSFGSRFDRAAAKASRRGDYALPFDSFTAQENLGKTLFIKGLGNVPELGCAVCHVPPTFGMAKSLNNGLELIYKDRGLGGVDRPVNDPFTPSNDGKFKAPSLRNVERTAPYMHDGRFETLE
ncbi:MAG: cytochrome-c peroxidase, partial [Deltaproteobacteria bacterium]|nr:cytochrome-c peroxidase [Deltaproteobacteria bacterium]